MERGEARGRQRERGEFQVLLCCYNHGGAHLYLHVCLD